MRGKGREGKRGAEKGGKGRGQGRRGFGGTERGLEERRGREREEGTGRPIFQDVVAPLTTVDVCSKSKMAAKLL